MMFLTLTLAAFSPAALAGTWSVDLRPTPESPAYTQPMTLMIDEKGAVTGTFYGAPIAAGRASHGNGRTCLAFNTGDQSGAYHHSGCLRGGVMEGLSWSTGRDFLLPWTAARGPAAGAPRP